MNELEAIIRLVVGAAMVDGRVDSAELNRIRVLARSVGAGSTLRTVIEELHRKQHELQTAAHVIEWVRPAARQIAAATKPTRFMAACAIARIVKEDGVIVADESAYQEAILEQLNLEEFEGI